MFDQSKASPVYGAGRARWCIGNKLYTGNGLEVPESVMRSDDERIEQGLDILPDEEVMPQTKRAKAKAGEAPVIPKALSKVASPHANTEAPAKPETVDPSIAARVKLAPVNLRRLRQIAAALAEDRKIAAPAHEAGSHAKARLIDWIVVHSE